MLSLACLALLLWAASLANAATMKTVMDTVNLSHTGNVFVNTGSPRTQKFAVGAEDVRITSVTVNIYDSWGSVVPLIKLCDAAGANCESFTTPNLASPGHNVLNGSYVARAGTTVTTVFRCLCAGSDGYGIYTLRTDVPGVTGPAPGYVFLAKAEGELMPSVSALSPASGAISGGQPVTISGAYLSDVTDVKFGSAGVASFTVLDANTITTEAPAQGAGTVDVTVTSPSGASAARASSRYTYIAPPASADGTSSVPYGASNAPISLSLSGGVPDTITLVAQAAHGAVSVSGTHVSYTPLAGYAGPDSFVYTASNIAGGTAPATHSIAVGAPTISYSPAAPAGASFGVPYSHDLASAGGGAAPYAYALANGTLPGGLNLSPGGLITGTPTAAGTFQFEVRATDSSTGAGPFTATSAMLSLTVSPPAIGLSPASLPAASVGTGYGLALSATGGTAPYTFRLLSGGWPNGMALSGSGALSGTPTSAGAFTVTVQATDSRGFTGSRTYSLAANAPALSILPATLPGGRQGVAYAQTVSASGGTPAYTFAVSSGSLPPGLTLAADTGAISGTPTTGGSYSFTVSLTDSTTGSGAPFSVSRPFTVAIAENRYTGPTSTGTGVATASFTGGGPGCTFTRRRFIGVHEAGTPPPSGYTFPQGMFDFTAQGCDVDSTLTVTLAYPSAIPPHAVLMKYSPTATPRWFPVSAQIQGNEITYAVRDGEAGDDDGAKDGRIVDPVALALPMAPATAVPTLSEWALAGLSLWIVGLGAARMRRHARRS
ncbi:MAG: IPTL-CTERM sorting domain-containing protein [Acidovorax sp.]|nr:IPTL-CTERM sorting domain-containing protein [Acidovorax sp.]